MRELRTFLAVVRHGTFARAGTQVGLTQSAVSAQIQRLEEELGVSLFHRTGRAATLSEAGRQAVPAAEAVLAAFATLADRAGAIEDFGLLRIGAIASAQASVLVSAIERFRAAAPGWRVRITPGVSLNLLAQVDGGELDAAVLVKPPFTLPAELQARTLLREPFVLLAPASMAGRAWRDALRVAPFVRYDRGSFGGRLVERFLKKTRIDVDEVVELDELQAIVGLVARGIGVALLPHAASLHLPGEVAVLPLGEHAFHREIVLVQRRAAGQSAIVAQFADCL
ncbi:LysR family transcriptional regulator [Chitinasiproducens palmae]